MKTKGSVTPAILVISGAFMVVIYGLLLLLVMQVDFNNRNLASETALSIAESGINYYRWHLAHDVTDFKDATTSAAPYVHNVLDPSGGNLGSYALTITPPATGSSVVTIKSVGTATSYPSVKRTIVAIYGRQSLAKYSFLQNGASWYGQGITVDGDIHSNTGIRMDGTNLGKVTSASASYTCGSETGCATPRTKPGVWGTGGDQALWDFPVPNVDFNAISFDFAQMKAAAQSSGLYLASSGASGYHIIFNSAGTFVVKKVTATGNIKGRDGDLGCIDTNQKINSEVSIGTYSVANIPIIFTEDNVWVEGTLKGKITVAAVRFPLTTSNAYIWIPNNLNYAAYDGTNKLGLIAQTDIYFARDIPDDFIVDGALIAQKGKIIRHGYLQGCGTGSTSLRDSLTIHGSVISFGKSYWNFSDIANSGTSGFKKRFITYDGGLLYEPPPFFPLSGDYEFISWKEQ